MQRRHALAAPLVVCLFAAACAREADDASGGEVSSAIQNPASATDVPEVVLVNLFCTGTLLSPTVVLTAGHCKAPTYTVTAPNAGGAVATASRDQSFFDGDPKTSHDVLLLFLDTAISLATYPSVTSTLPPAGTNVVEVGRSQSGQVTGSLWKTTDAVSITGPADTLGFPYNIEALPDVSQDGDSGGAVFVAGTHQLVAIVDTDTIEQGITEEEPIDLFARVDQLHDAIEAAIASGPPPSDAGAEEDASTNAAAPSASSGCSMRGASRSDENSAVFAIGMFACALAARRRRR